MKVTAPEFQQWERFYRANFINSLSGYKSASLIGTCNAEKKLTSPSSATLYTWVLILR